MKLLPTRDQWKRWSLTAKLTAIGTYAGLLSLAFYAIEKMLAIPDVMAHWSESHSGNKPQPTVKFALTQANAYQLILDVPISKLKRLPTAKKDSTISWRATPTRLELNNPSATPMSFRNFELLYLTKEEDGLAKCKHPDFVSDEDYAKGQRSGFFTWIVRDKNLNPNNEINIPINLEANHTRVIYMDFLTIPLMPNAIASTAEVDMNKFNAFCIKWIDQNGTKHLSEIYFPLAK